LKEGSRVRGVLLGTDDLFKFTAKLDCPLDSVFLSTGGSNVIREERSTDGSDDQYRCDVLDSDVDRDV
jgi:hypothetical protein